MSLSQAFNAGSDYAIEKIAADPAQIRDLQRMLKETRSEDAPSRLRSGLGNAAGFGILLGGGALAGGAAGRGVARMMHGPGLEYKNSVFKMPGIIGGAAALAGGALGASQDPEEVKKEKIKFLKDMLQHSKHASAEDLAEAENRYTKLEREGPATRGQNMVAGAGSGALLGGLGGLGFAGMSHLFHPETRPNKAKFWKDPVHMAGGVGLGLGAAAGLMNPESLHRKRLGQRHADIIEAQGDV